jgi:CRP-like cAMP-binding protein
MMALISGTIRISVRFEGGKELLLAIIQPGEVFGELAVLDEKERSADAVAENACTLTFWTVATFYRSSNEPPPLGQSSSQSYVWHERCSSSRCFSGKTAALLLAAATVASPVGS